MLKIENSNKKLTHQKSEFSFSYPNRQFTKDVYIYAINKLNRKTTLNSENDYNRYSR